MPALEAHLISGAGHILAMQVPSVVDEHIRSFVEQGI